MSMWLVILGVIYVSLLAFLANKSRKKNASLDDFMLGGGNMGLFVGSLTVAATLFSTFTLMGMPNFFRTHGVGAWIFLAVADGAFVFLILWFGYILRKKVANKGFKGVAGLLNDLYETKLAGYVFFGGVFLFLIPYVAIQINGIAVFLANAFPDFVPMWGWGVILVVVMLIYSETGGLKAIIYADVMQAILLLLVVWIIAGTCVSKLGGVGAMFEQVENIEPRLLSTPGPNGLFTTQFLFGFMLAILMVPVTQPQITTRLVIMRDIRTTHKMAVAVGTFAMLVIMPTIAIGFYGAVKYADLTIGEYLTKVLLDDQLAVIGAAAIIGLFAAAISTSDSQLFALGSEIRSLLKGEDKKILTITRICIFIFALAALIFAILSGDDPQLVLIAQKGFAGTAIMGPMILTAIMSSKAPSKIIIYATAVGLLWYLSSLLIDAIPRQFFGMNLDWFILVSLAVVAVVSALLSKSASHE